jgi:hypothetical protein
MLNIAETTVSRIQRPMKTEQRRKLRIGLLLNQYTVPAWFYASIERAARLGCAEIVLVVINAKSDLYGSRMNRLLQNYHKLLYFIYRKLDELLFKQKRDAFERKDIRQLLGSAAYLAVTPVQKKFSDYLEPNDIERIKAFDLDILVRGGFRILRGEILKASRYGIWSYHHGDNTVNRGGPAGFWEVVEGWPETGAILQILSESLDGGTVLYRSWSTTYLLSPARNRNRYYWTTSAFLPRQIKRLHELGEEKFFSEVQRYNRGLNCYDRRLYRAPNNRESMRIYWRMLNRLAKRGMQYLLFRNQWILLIDVGRELSTSFRGFKKIFPPKDRFWADPFVVFNGGKYTLFIEEYVYAQRKGHIAAMEVDEKGRIGPPRVVLREEFHLSYPFVFKWQDRYYMVPETSADRSIRIYECTDFPTQWTLKATLIAGIIAVDPTLVYKDGLWWLFAGVAENEAAPKSVELSLFYSRELFSGDWTPHPMNPLVSDVKNARPGGRMIEKNGRLYRISQDCSKRYGHGLNINEIVVLTETQYEEKLVERVGPNWDNKILAMHTLNHDHKLTVIDGLISRPRFGIGRDK